MNLLPLVAEQIPLTGKHLIEASAGTGKTFNITRIYLRLLLEKKLTVEQILVMTFTKDATEEIRSRIGNTLRATLSQWDELVTSDPFYQSLAQSVAKEQAFALINRALLFLDDAAIFTIHGFCKRVLTQYAFDSGLLFNMQMESGCQDQMLEAVQDWYRLLSKSHPEQYLSVAEFWPEPTTFIQVFSRALNRKHEILVPNKQSIFDVYIQEVQVAKSSLLANQPLLFEALVDNQKGDKRDVRIHEYEQLIGWLEKASVTTLDDVTKYVSQSIPASFCDGRRYSKSKVKSQLVDAFTPVNTLKDTVKSLEQRLKKADAFQIIVQGINDINISIEQKKKQGSLLSFDDLIEVLADKLDEIDNNKLSQQLYQQFPAAMVDEFQDTDPHQFSILQAIYQHQAKSCLFLIGDPKQAIYGFRGGDIFTYLSARGFCQYQWVMDTNWRSSAQVIQGYNRLFYGGDLNSEGKEIFGHGIPYNPVTPSYKIPAEQYKDNDCALQFVHFSNNEDKPFKPAFRATMADWLSNKIVTLLNDNTEGVSAADIAILVRDGTEANIVKESLEAKQLASVYLSNRSNLWLTAQASQLLLVLKGVLFYEQDRFFNAALASGLLGFNADSLLALQQDELAWQDQKFAFKALKDEWRYKGFISAALKLLHQHIKLDSGGKERALTNLLHLVELLQNASKRHHQAEELLYWFEQQQRLDLSDNEAELRLESDEHLIKIVTQHGSKGLEYPIVFVPFATRHKNPNMIGNRKVTVLDYHNEQGQLITALEGSDEARQHMCEEAYAESIRLLYVAVTRAVQRCYMLTANFEQCHLSPLGITLGWQEDTDLQNALSTLSVNNPDSIGLELVDDGESNQVDINNSQFEETLVIHAARFLGSIERDWWLSSFTALSRNLRHGGVSLPDRDTNETAEQFIASKGVEMRFELAKGAHTGNLLHDLLEQVSFDEWDWFAIAQRLQTKYLSILDGWQLDTLVDWLRSIASSPLSDSLTLESLTEKNVLKEQEFYFPMKKASSQKLASLLYQHRNRISPNMASGAIKLPAYQQLKGMMHGFIDLIFEHKGKYYVCDYKSSHLGNQFAHYENEALNSNIAKNYYDLQYLIYSLALHRLLKSRLPNYDSEIHFGGVYYLYLRGMAPNTTSGVFYSDISTQELDALDMLFDGESC
ncbi:exodeoxyribonuclease V subunit beta [Thalassotalea sp. M1531]|uniref:RecBCD enzyme subunit RecB n=1 Tax=Thalassotalea algicola TaxID=2716224 RepID=A0A7Y0LCC0_9GAMM|nr:exodeoxyribonuclease V subunit beta [Thalassotalea algicola]NMP31568.1 exodeoxyribonuclease V subunit beta [Thalassotalea algicola]